MTEANCEPIASQKISSFYSDISEESDDLETPLEVWQRLIGKPCPEQNNSLAKIQCEKAESSGIRGNNLKRKNRHRVSSHEPLNIYSSDSDSLRQAKPSHPNRRLRSKRNKTAGTKDRKKFATKKTKKIINLSTSPAKRATEGLIDPICDNSDSKKAKLSSSLRRSKRHSIRNTAKKSRKNPIEFLKYTSVEKQSKFVSSDSSLDDSQKTILLDTPEFADSLEILEKDSVAVEKDAKDEVVNANGDYLSINSDNDNVNNNCPNTDKNISYVSNEKTANNKFLSGDSPKKASVNFNDTEKHLKKKQTTSKNLDTESTELDDIFFKANSNSPKKPPPGRLIKEADATSPAVAESTTQESVCSSLWDDDSLWVVK